MASDELLAMATLESSSEAMMKLPSESAAEIKSIVCVGRIVSHTALEDDRHNILLVGIQRARIIQELDAGRTFRIAEVEILDDLYPPEGSGSRGKLKQELLEAFAAVIPQSENAKKGLHDLMAGQMGLGPITDIVSYTLPFDVNEKIELLGQRNVDQRARSLIDLLGTGKIQLHSVTMEEQTTEQVLGDQPNPNNGNESTFPPPFSLN